MCFLNDPMTGKQLLLRHTDWFQNQVVCQTVKPSTAEVVRLSPLTVFFKSLQYREGQVWKVAKATAYVIINRTKKSSKLFHKILPTQGRSKSNCLFKLPVSRSFKSYQFTTCLCLSSCTKTGVSSHCVPEFQVCITKLKIWGFQLFPSTLQIKSWPLTNLRAVDKLHSFLKII